MNKREVKKKRSWLLSNLNVTMASATTVLSVTSCKKGERLLAVQAKLQYHSTILQRKSPLLQVSKKMPQLIKNLRQFLGGEAESISEDEEMDGHVPSAVAPPPRKRRRVEYICTSSSCSTSQSEAEEEKGGEDDDITGKDPGLFLYLQGCRSRHFSCCCLWRWLLCWRGAGEEFWYRPSQFHVQMCWEGHSVQVASLPRLMLHRWKVCHRSKLWNAVYKWQVLHLVKGRWTEDCTEVSCVQASVFQLKLEHCCMLVSINSEVCMWSCDWATSVNECLILFDE